MKEKIKLNEMKNKRKILKILNIFLAAFLSLIVSVSVMSLTMFLNTLFGLNFLNCILFSVTLTYISSCGVNLILKPLDNKCRRMLLDIKELEQQSEKNIDKKELFDIRLRFGGLSSENKRKVLNYIKENAVSSGLGDAPIRWIVDDCVKFVEREIRRGNHYDAIIMDPPSYGRGPKGEIWKIEDSIYPFIELCTQILSEDALFFLVNSYTTGLQPAVLTYMIHTAVVTKFGGKVEAAEIGLPVKDTGLVLPCGASGRWYQE